MPPRLALVIGLETYADPDLPAVPHGEVGAGAFARALEGLGLSLERQIVLLGAQATRTALASKLRRLPKDLGPDEGVFLFYAGRVFSEGGRGFLTCHDTLADDPVATSLAFSEVVEALGATGSGRLVLFLDAHPAGLPDVTPHLDPDELGSLLGPQTAAFFSCAPGETPQASGLLKKGVWIHLVVEALTGNAPLALAGNGLLTAGSLARYLEQEVPRTLRKVLGDPDAQSPCSLGAGPGLVVADLTEVLAGRKRTPDPHMESLRRGTFRAETYGRVKALSGYRKHHHLPDRITASTRRFVAELAADDLEADLEAYYSALREYMGYKRRDLDLSLKEGTGRLGTPDFDYVVRVAQAEDDPAGVVWQREVGNIRTPEVIAGPGFQKVFGGIFDTLVFEFGQPFDVESWVDRVEDDAPEGVKVRCASDASSCEVTVPGFRGVLRLWPDRVEVQGPPGRSSTGPLVQTFLEFRGLFTGPGAPESLLLPGPSL
jgi:hypothetical protein